MLHSLTVCLLSRSNIALLAVSKAIIVNNLLLKEKEKKKCFLTHAVCNGCSFCSFWLGIDQNARRRMSREKTDVILKVVVKHFFIEKEVTSTLVMDSLYSGLKALEGQNKSKKGRARILDSEEMTAPIVRVEKDIFVLVDDVLLLLERAALEPLPPKDEKGPQNRTKVSMELDHLFCSISMVYHIHKSL